MYISPECKQLADTIFTEREQLYGSLTPERLVSLLERPDANILSFAQSTNNYGEFYFITFELVDIGVFSFYGLGENDSTDSFQRNFKDNDVCFANPNYDYRTSQAFRLARPDFRNKNHKAGIIETIKRVMQETSSASTKPKSAQGRAFSFLEEFMDADGAQSFMEDFPDIVDDF